MGVVVAIEPFWSNMANPAIAFCQRLRPLHGRRTLHQGRKWPLHQGRKEGRKEGREEGRNIYIYTIYTYIHTYVYYVHMYLYMIYIHNIFIYVYIYIYSRYNFLTVSLPKRLLNGRSASKTAVRVRRFQKRNGHLGPEVVYLLESSRYDSFSRRRYCGHWHTVYGLECKGLIPHIIHKIMSVA
jgi:hypothetical protein